MLQAEGSNAEGSNFATTGQPESPHLRVLDVGCGNNKVGGAIGIDRVALPGVDVVHDLNSFPYPFDSNSFDEIRLIHVIEHLDSIIRVMEEIHRIVRPGGRVTIITPHYSDFQSWNDPTHKWHLTTFSFRYFEPGWESSYYSSARFKIESIHIDMARLWRPLGVEALINLSLRRSSLRSIRKFWEGYLSFLLRAGAMTFILSPLK
jgi:SAM-dependent methyltransferase